MKKNLFLLFIILVGFTTHVQGSVKIGDLYYDFNDVSLDSSSVCVTWESHDSNNYSSLSGIVKIPETVEINNVIYKVKAIGFSAFARCQNIIEISIPSTITIIREMAFNECYSLKKLILEDGDENIFLDSTVPIIQTGKGMFADCPLETLYLGRNIRYLDYSSSFPWEENVRNYGYSAFYGQTRLSDVTIGSKVTFIQGYTFYCCTSLTSIEIPSSVISIGKSAFAGCTSLSSIKIPDTVTTIENSVFSGCTGLSSIKIPDSVTTFEDGLFSGCTGLSSIKIPNFITCINGFVFYGCISLSHVEIPSSVTSIGNYAFYRCSSLASIEIPDAVTSIGDYAFYGCSSLASIEIPSSVVSIGSYVFNECKDLKNITFADGEDTIKLGYSNYVQNGVGAGLFADCPLETLYLGRNISYSSYSSGYPWDKYASRYGYSAFYGQSKLSNITIGTKVTAIEAYTFDNCESITGNMILPVSINSIGTKAFAGCNGINLLIVNPTIPPSTASDALLDWDYSSVKLIVPSSSLMKYRTTTPWSNFTEIQGFYVKDNIIYLLDQNHKAKIIGVENTLEDFTNLEILPSVLVNEESYTVETISGDAFKNCVRLKGTLTIPSTVTSIGSNAFIGCPNITVVKCGAQIPPKCEGSLFDDSVYQNALLKVSTENAYASAVEWNKFKYINVYQITLNGISYKLNPENNEAVCIGLESKEILLTNPVIQSKIIFRDNSYTVTSIALQAFENCTGLKGTLTIPASIESIGSKAFAGCTGIDELIAMGTTVPNASSDAFQGWNYSSVPLIVPADALQSYKSATPWNSFVNIKASYTLDNIVYTLTSDNTATIIGVSDTAANFENLTIPGTVSVNNSSYTVTTIGEGAFENCTGLRGTLTIPASIRSIGAKAFAGCTGITQVNSEAATAPVCDGEMFSESVYKNALLKVSDESAYSNAQGWSQFVNINGYNVVIDSIAYRLPYGANQAICVGLDNSSEILNGIKLQSSVNINNSTYPVTSIALQAFENCTGLKGTLTIPASIESIGSKAFAGCTGIDELIAMGTTVPNASSDAFQGWNYSSVPLIVPADALQSYKSAIPWNSFANIKASYTLDNIVYTLNADNTATIIGVSDTAANFENLTIPGTVSVNNSSYTVTTIGEGAFENCTGLRGTLTIPATVTSIGTNAFGGCTNITHVYCLASKPPVCDDVVFHDDVHQNALLIVDDNLAYSKDKVWSNFKNINGYAYQIEDGNYLLDPSTGDVTYMGPNDPSGLKGVLYIPSQVEIDGATHTITGIGDEALKDATLLTSVVIPPTITSVGTDAFTGCTGLIKNGYPSSISNPFKNGVNVAYPNDGVFEGKTIYSGTQSSLFFVSIDEEGDFQIPSTVNTIAANAFSYCSELTNLSIPSSVSTINSNSFTATAVKSISIDTPVIGNWFSGYTSLESLTLGNDVTTISDDAFAGCSGLVTLIIPQNVTSIGNGAFSGCPITNLTYNAINCVNCGSPQSPAFEDQIKILTIGDNVTSIPDYFLYKGNKIQNLSIPNRVTQIGTSAFNNSNMLKSLTLGAGLLSVSKSMFGGNQIPKVYWLGNTPPEGYNQLRGLVNYTSNDRYNFMDGAKEVSPIIYPFLSSKFEVDGVVYVPVSPSDRTSDVIDCNYYATGEEVVIPASVLYQNVELSVYNISDYAFYDNTNFSSLVLSEIVDKIGNSAFENCNRITSLTFPAAVSSIGDYAFAKCSSVTEIYFNDERFDTDVITLGSNGQNGLFSDCPLVKLYNGRKLEYQPGSSYGYSPFAQIRTLQDVEISDYEIKVGDYEFYGCSALTSLIIGNSVKTIGDWAFSGCYSLKYYSAGLAVETIGEEAFSDCTSVTEFYSYSAVPPVCGNQSLDDINKWNCTLYVPASSLSKYQQEPQWKDFFHIEGMEEPQVAEIRLDKSDESILIGEALQLNATILPAEASNAVLTWTSSDNSVATVSINGLVIGLSAGTATITASYGNVSAECVVTVTKEAGIGNLYNYDPVTINVYNLQGVKFTIRDMNELNQLNPGIYIVNGKKVMIR